MEPHFIICGHNKIVVPFVVPFRLRYYRLGLELIGLKSQKTSINQCGYGSRRIAMDLRVADYASAKLEKGLSKDKPFLLSPRLSPLYAGYNALTT